MNKRLIVCCDGTWNRAENVDHGKPAPTNVRRLYLAIDQSKDAAVLQDAHYEQGVGTRRWEHLRGGALGFGLSANVRSCYAWLVQRYEPGDELFLFGFSRGAFTARSLAGLVRNSGILRPEHAGMVKDAYKLYRSRKPGDAPSESAAKKFRDDHSHPDAEITFIGVWDTVGALGIPIDGFRPPWLTKRWTFHDTTLSKSVHNAYHAVSIDERRKPFEPTLWVKKVREDGTVEEPPPQQTVRQVWFAGVHSDVGGGYADASLSAIPLQWMAARARACGLVLTPGQPQLAPNPEGEMHDSMTFFYRHLLGGPYDRELKAREGDPISSSLASSSKLRYEKQAAYRPLGLSEWVTGGRDVSDVDH
jgi:uncharacterized protein (DUF2235 family)